MNISVYLKKANERKIFAFTLLATLVVGFICGLFLNTILEKLFATDNVIAFYTDALTGRGSFAGVFFMRLFSDACVTVVFFGISFVGVVFPLYYPFLFFRAYALGTFAVAFVTHFGISGVLVWFAVVTIPEIITDFALVAFAVLARSIKSKCEKDKKERLYIFVACLVAELAASLLSLLVLLVFLRPLFLSY